MSAGDTVHVLSASADEVIDNLSGQLVVTPDRLLSGTSVVSAVFCARKAVLNELFRGLEPGNKAMLVGTLVHQLFQEVRARERRSRQRSGSAFETGCRGNNSGGKSVSEGRWWSEEIEMQVAKTAHN